jgi:predicted phosphodiesterase
MADLHGRRAQLEALLNSIGSAAVETVIMVGDYLDCKVSKRALSDARPTAVGEVVDVDRGLWDRLRGLTLVRGNQEERIGSLIDGLPGHEELGPLLTAPAALDAGRLHVTHGHTFDWSRYTGRWVPTLDDALPDAPVVVFGHSHQPGITTLADDAGSWRYHESILDPSAEIQLDRHQRYLVNLAPAKDSLRWLLHDDESGTITWRNP